MESSASHYPLIHIGSGEDRRNTSANLSRVKPHSSLDGGPTHMKPPPVDPSSRGSRTNEKNNFDFSDEMRCRNFCNTGKIKMVLSRKEGGRRKKKKKEVETLGNSIGNVTSASLGRTRHGHTEEYGFLGWTSKLFAIRRDESPSVTLLQSRQCKNSQIKMQKKGYEPGIDSSSLDDGPRQPYLARLASS